MLCIAGDADCHAALRLAMTFFSATGPIGRPQAIALWNRQGQISRPTVGTASFKCYSLLQTTFSIRKSPKPTGFGLLLICYPSGD